MKCECCENDSLFTGSSGMRLCGSCAKIVDDHEKRQLLFQPTIEEGFPKHVGLTLEHNEHKIYYYTITDWLDHFESPPDWVSEEQKAKAIATNSCWTIRWYPNTPVGSIFMAACDLEVLLEEVNKP